MRGFGDVMGGWAAIGQLAQVLHDDFARPANRTHAQRLTLVIVRVGQLVHERRMRGVVRLLWRLADVIYLRIVMGAEFSPSARIGPGLAVPHAGRGVSIADDAVIGGNCMIFPFVTIGRDGRSASPCLEDDVTVGTGARILGPVTVGSRARVGANSVVIRDVPDGATAFGVPARNLRHETGST
jgi:serine O-acetyltransferase